MKIPPAFDVHARMPSIHRAKTPLVWALIAAFLSVTLHAADAPPPRPATEPDEARISIQAEIKNNNDARRDHVAGLTFQQHLKVSPDAIEQIVRVEANAIRGDLQELVIAVNGVGTIQSVTGEDLEDWNVRQNTSGQRSLLLRLKKTETPRKLFRGEIRATTPRTTESASTSALTFTSDPPVLSAGYVRLEAAPGFQVELEASAGLVPIDPGILPDPLHTTGTNATPAVLAFRFLGSAYALPVRVVAADPELDRVVLRDFALLGQLQPQAAVFQLQGTAQVRNSKGGRMELLSGGAALSEFNGGTNWSVRLENGRYVAVFEKPGVYPLQLRFHAGIQSTNGWNRVQFRVPTSALQPLQLQGPKPGTQFRFAGAAAPEFKGDSFSGFLPSSGWVDLSWKEARAEAEGALFFAVDQLNQISVSPGMLRQSTVLEFQIMQGELSQATLVVQGAGEITRITGAQVLSWKVDPINGTPNRRLTLRFNQPQKVPFSIVLQTQTALAAFPTTARPLQWLPEGATRVGGHFRVMNDGAVKLEILEATGLSQISPTQFPQTESSKALGAVSGSQVFAFRYAGGNHTLQIQADNILPEVAVSQATIFHVGENESVIDSELELEIREAPLREWQVRIPKGYSLAHIEAQGLADYFITDTGTPESSLLRLVYGAPVEGRQLIQLRLERNAALGTNLWVLPRFDFEKARSSRGHIGVSADAGYRVSPTAVGGLTEMATAFFPRKVPRLQTAFRITEATWQARVGIERVPQSIQADSLHLFSVGEGIAYGSSLINYAIAGAPISTLRVALTNEYFNVEFTGKDIRSWQRTDEGYVVQLHSGVTGTYTLLTTYERPFKPQGEVLRFVGAQPLDAQTEQGHTVVVSTHQFQIQATNASPGLVALEPGEVPAEYRLFFDAPILAAYRYSSRPFNLQLRLEPLSQGDSIRQLVERAAIVTRISKDGQAVTDSQYFLKSQNAPHLQFSLPANTELWSVSVNGTEVVPISNGTAKLIPLPPKSDANSVQEIRLKTASRSLNPKRALVQTPALAVSTLLASWSVEGESGQAVRYVTGPLAPEHPGASYTVLDHLINAWQKVPVFQRWMPCGSVVVLMLLAWVMLRSARGPSTHRFSLRHLVCGGVLFAALALALVIGGSFLQSLLNNAEDLRHPVQFVARIQNAGIGLSATVENLPLKPTAMGRLASLWPCWVGIAAAVYALTRSSGVSRQWSIALAGWLVFWGLLRQPDTAALVWYGGLAVALFSIGVPALRAWWSAPPRPPTSPTPGVQSGAPGLAALLALLVPLTIATPWKSEAQTIEAVGNYVTALAEVSMVEIQTFETHAAGTATLRWNAKAGQVLPLVREPGILTSATIPPALGRLTQIVVSNKVIQCLVAANSGPMEVRFEFQAPVTTKGGEQSLILPTTPGVIHRVKLTLPGRGFDVVAARAISILPTNPAGKDSQSFDLVLTPDTDAAIAWRPKSRDTKSETAVYFADWHHLVVPNPGVIDAAHQVVVRPAQGELTELTFETAPGLTVTDVASGPVVLWRFDPVSNRLRVTLNPAQSKPFTLRIRSQTPVSPLPYERTPGLVRLLGAAEQAGFIGIATGTEVQLESAPEATLGSMNLADFPKALVEEFSKTVPGLALRRAFRQDPTLLAPAIRAAAVEADIRVEAQQSLSLAEDRLLLAANLRLAILRAGIFKFSFALPPGLEVESISGATLSHWTDVRQDTNRWVTLHLKGRTEGEQTFALSLVGTGVRTATNWVVPQFRIREASKQTGQLLLAPEQGLRLQVQQRDGATQLDPVQAGVQQRGVLLFRLLQADWRLTLNLERVDAWTQVVSLQRSVLEEARVQTEANLQFEIENAGVKSLRVRLPADAEGVRFRGDPVTDFVPSAPVAGSATRDWEIRMQRRIHGRTRITVQYSQPYAEGATNAALRTVEALDVHLQRGFLSVQGGRRLEASVLPDPSRLQSSDLESLPRALFENLGPIQGHELFRLVEGSAVVGVRIQRHEAERVLPARVDRLTLSTIPSQGGSLLTRAELTLVPGDKQLLPVTLPEGASFWAAFVGGNSARTWRDAGRVLIPLEQHARTAEPVTVEFYYLSTAPAATRGGQFTLRCPKFDLPLENIRWHVYLAPQWSLTSWDGNFQLEDQGETVANLTADAGSYLQLNSGVQAKQSQEAAQYLNLGNALLEKGDPDNARRAFQNAFGLSQHDMAFNEDARVQLHNLKTQQALVGLNFRQALVAGGERSLTNAPAKLRAGVSQAYTQQEARQLMDRNSAEENAVQMRLVERLIQQQEATAAHPIAIKATLPELGRRITFSRSLQIDRDRSLSLSLKVAPTTSQPRWSAAKALGFMALAFGAILALRWAIRTSLPSSEPATVG